MWLPIITTIQYIAILAVYVVLQNGTTLQHAIGLIGIVMACYGRKSKFADVEASDDDNGPKRRHPLACKCDGGVLWGLRK